MKSFCLFYKSAKFLLNMECDSDEFCEMPQVTDKPRKKILNNPDWKKKVLKQLKYDA